MSEIKHTPGPWYTDGGSCGVFHEGGTSRIATIEGDFTSYRIANARLIAAAPELKDALVELLAAELASYPSEAAGREAQDAWADRRAAARNNASAVIAKATGR